MTWFLALQGAAHMQHQTSAYELQDSADVGELEKELMGAVMLDRVVPVPAMLPQNGRKQQKVTLYVRPAAWALWTFYQLSDEDRRQLTKENPLLNALQAAQRGQAAAAGQVNPLTGQPGPGNVNL
ncbi:hypothetical protein [Mycolicibacterium hodleri]|uniref:Uncharacterized protein n=1 Tax=Mycolicibacterium hodleri TaxID=49897 RepID=A0A502E1U7_9MYCO|nr:hypothetical protein [Mycolicibacterium hodleri]TPG31304.1 hypothetical protein EAH80_25115 [Mycolicibacterium hodleri]